jgi:uroporphyrinogen-III synthase
VPPFRPTLLVTRPQQAAERFAAQFRARFRADWPVVLSPLMQTLWLSPALDRGDVRDVIFTSETAVRAFARLSPDRDLLAWCVGGRTAEAAREAGFEAVEGPGDARGLAALIMARRRGARLLWPHGRHRAADMAELLKPAGIETVSVVAYEQVSRPLTGEAGAQLARTEPLLVPLFSPRSARLFTEAATGRAAPLWIAALSPAVADAAAALTPARLETAARPDSESLLDALARLTQDPAGG